MPDVSPTGTPVLSPKVVPWLTALASVLAAGVATLPSHTLAWRICAGLSGLFGIMGIVSPGLRKKDAP